MTQGGSNRRGKRRAEGWPDHHERGGQENAREKPSKSVNGCWRRTEDAEFYVQKSVKPLKARENVVPRRGREKP